MDMRIEEQQYPKAASPCTMWKILFYTESDFNFKQRADKYQSDRQDARADP